MISHPAFLQKLIRTTAYIHGIMRLKNMMMRLLSIPAIYAILKASFRNNVEISMRMQAANRIYRQCVCYRPVVIQSAWYPIPCKKGL
jgi:hypothetical protein